jgi:hypothetical protein
MILATMWIRSRVRRNCFYRGSGIAFVVETSRREIRIQGKVTVEEIVDGALCRDIPRLSHHGGNDIVSVATGGPGGVLRIDDVGIGDVTHGLFERADLVERLQNFLSLGRIAAVGESPPKNGLFNVRL